MKTIIRSLDKVSSVPGEEGYEVWRKALDDGYHMHVYLDGAWQKGCFISASASEGWVKRTKTKNDSCEPRDYMHDGENWLEETVRGEVAIHVVQP